MFVSPVGTVNRSIYATQKTKKAQKPQEVPSFKNSFAREARLDYFSRFITYFKAPVEQYSNKEIFKGLMEVAVKGFADFEETNFIQKYFRPDRYNQIMESFRNGDDVYDNISDNSYHKPSWLLCNEKEDRGVVSVVNFGRQGGLFNLIFGNSSIDTRICFNGISSYKDCVICLGRDNEGNDYRMITEDGLGTLIGSEIASKL